MKKRNCNICNLKSLLLFLVVIGHALERDISYDGAAAAIYRVIYLFHMPLFVFVSGLGMKNKESCLRHGKQALKYYLCAQGVVIVFKLLFSPETVLEYVFRPYWHLWYLLSLAGWCFLGAGIYKLLSCVSAKRLMLKKFGILLFAVAAGLLAGVIPPVGRVLSLSRTFVFFPFFLAGVFWGTGMIEWISDKIRLVVLALPAAVMGAVIIGKIPVDFLYQAKDYFSFGLTWQSGIMLRVTCYLTAIACSMVVIILCPKGKSLMTWFGGDTLMIYLLHVIFIRGLEFIPYPMEDAVPFSILYAVMTIAGIYICFKWSRQIFIYVDTQKHELKAGHNI